MMVKGYVKIRKNKVLVAEGPNLVTSVGKELFAQAIADDGTPSRISHTACGSDNTISAASMTALQGTEHDRQTATTTRTDNSILYSATLGAGISSTVSVGEFGLFDASSGGNMFCRFTFGTKIEVTAADELDVDWSIQVGD